MNKVFIPIVPTRYDPISERRKPSVDLTPSRMYGETSVLIPEALGYDPQSMFDIQPLVDMICDGMEESEEEDYIVAVGDPVLIAAAAACQVEKFGSVRMLRWDRQDQRYRIMEFKI